MLPPDARHKPLNEAIELFPELTSAHDARGFLQPALFFHLSSSPFGCLRAMALKHKSQRLFSSLQQGCLSFAERPTHSFLLEAMAPGK
jgi:hypothetical protein